MEPRVEPRTTQLIGKPPLGVAFCILEGVGQFRSCLSLNTNGIISCVLVMVKQVITCHKVKL